jgi:hypothetical protein
MTFKNFLLLIYKKNKLLSAMIIALVCMSLTLGFSFVNLLANYNIVNDTYADLRREEYQFVLKKQPIASEKMSLIQAMYHIDALEIHASKYIINDNHHVRLVKTPKEVNKLQVISGRLPAADGELVLEHKIAQHNKHALGDTITLSGKAYDVVGFVEYPNLVAPNMAVASYAPVNSARDMLVSVSDAAYEKIVAEEQQYYVAIGGELTKIKADSAHFLAEADNPELNKVAAQRAMLTTALGIGLVIMLSIIIILVFLVIAKTIAASMNEIGVMLTFGYKKVHILLSLACAILTYFSVALVALVASELLKEPVFSFFNEAHLVSYEVVMTWHSNMILLLATLCLVFTLVYGYSMYLLRKRTIISLVLASGKNKVGKFTRKIFALSGKRINQKFILHDLIVCFLLFFAGFAVMVQLLFGFGMMQYTEKLATARNTRHAYNYVYNIMDVSDANKEMQLPGAHQYYFKSKLQTAAGDTLALLTLDTSGEQLIDVGHTLAQTEGLVVNKWLANKYGLQQGDTIDVTLEERDLKLKIGAIDEGVFFGQDVYVSADYYRSHISSDIAYNGLYSEHALGEQTSIHVLFETKKESVLATVEDNMTLLQTTATGMIVLGALIGGIIVLISLDVLLRNHRKNILLLKVLGYKNSRIYGLIVRYQLLFVLLGTAIAIPYFSFITSILFTEISKTGTIFYDFSPTGGSSMLLLVVINALFLLGSRAFFTSVVRRKNFGALYGEE